MSYIECPKCKVQMEFINCNDDPIKGLAHNVYVCDDCFVIARENVWCNTGTVYVFPNNTVRIDVEKG